MSSNFNDVGLFHQKFDLDNAVERNHIGPRKPSEELIKFRLKFLKEELHELEEGLEVHDLTKVADALIDLAYVTFGFAHVLGLPWQELWNEVQKANMQKIRAIRAEDSTRGSTYDVIKPKGWTPPNLEEVLEWYGWKRCDCGCGKIGVHQP